jgi:hypothetical protein
MGQFYNGVWYPTGTSPSDGGLPTGNMYGGGSGSPVEEILKAYPPGGQAWSDQDIMDWGSQPQYGQAQPQGAFSDASDYFSE